MTPWFMRRFLICLGLAVAIQLVSSEVVRTAAAQKPSLSTVTDEMQRASAERRATEARAQLTALRASVAAKSVSDASAKDRAEENARLQKLEEYLQANEQEKAREVEEVKDEVLRTKARSEAEWGEVRKMGWGVIGAVLVASILGFRKWFVDRHERRQTRAQLESLRETSSKIFHLVNSGRTELMKRVLASSISQLTALEELAEMRQSRGEPVRAQLSITIQVTKEEINTMRQDLAEQEEANA